MPEIYPLEWSNERLKILDQTKLPKEQAVIIANNYVDVLDSIKSMSIRGGSVLSIAAAYALTLAAKSVSTNDVQKFLEYLENKFKGKTSKILNIDKFHLVGFSIGSLIALNFAFKVL